MGKVTKMIEGVSVRLLRQILDERGKIMHMLKASDAHFLEFGEIYFSSIQRGAIKAWHLHKEMTLNYAVPIGKIKFVLYDDRENSATQGVVQEIFMGPENYVLVTVPPYVWNGFKGIADGESIIANCATLPHDANEIVRLDPLSDRIPYDWAIKHG